MSATTIEGPRFDCVQNALMCAQEEKVGSQLIPSTPALPLAFAIICSVSEEIIQCRTAELLLHSERVPPHPSPVTHRHRHQLIVARQHDQRVPWQLLRPQVDHGPVEVARHAGCMVDVACHSNSGQVAGILREVHEVLDELACMHGAILEDHEAHMQIYSLDAEHAERALSHPKQASREQDDPRQAAARSRHGKAARLEASTGLHTCEHVEVYGVHKADGLHQLGPDLEQAGGVERSVRMALQQESSARTMM